MPLSISNKSFKKIREPFFIFRQETLDQSIKNFVEAKLEENINGC